MDSIIDIIEAIDYRKQLIEHLESVRGKIPANEFTDKLFLIAVIDEDINRSLREHKLPGVMGTIYHWIFG